MGPTINCGSKNMFIMVEPTINCGITTSLQEAAICYFLSWKTHEQWSHAPLFMGFL
jgi:hypothetical protein